MGDAVVDINPTRKLAEQLKSEYAAGLKTVMPEAARVLDDILGRNAPTLSFADAQVLRSDLLAVGRTSTEQIPGRAQATAKQLAAQLDSSMADAATKLGPDAIAAWRTANQFWKTGKETFNNRLIKSIAAKDPEAVFQAAIRNGMPGTIRRMRQIVGNDNWTAIQGQFLADALAKATDTAGELSGSGLLRQIKLFEGTDGAALREMFPDAAHIHNLKMLANSLRIAQRQQSGTGSVFIQMAQAGALVGSPWLHLGVEGTILLGPAVLGKLLTNNTMARWLSVGMTAPAGTEAAITATTKLAAYFTQQGLMNGE